ncbi:hypothetical protein DFJ74DRAFT_701060 [Hyaloraphidium curvatum]|nr:hypothetical protein DFJ74DRAFT_701060 [Hyaloraphidium curvatum]
MDSKHTDAAPAFEAAPAYTAAPPPPPRTDAPETGAPFGFSTFPIKTHLRYAGKAPPRHIVAAALAGGTTVDLRGALLPPGETVVEAYALCGSVRVVAPPDVKVVVDGIGILGGYRDERVFYAGVSADQAQDRWVRVRGAALLAGVKCNFAPKSELKAF